jgi:hypothetical protein
MILKFDLKILTCDTYLEIWIIWSDKRLDISPRWLSQGPGAREKTTLLRQLFPKIHYVLLEDPDIQGWIRSDPRTFLEELRPPILIRRNSECPRTSQLRAHSHRYGAPSHGAVAIHRIAGSTADAGHHRVDGRPGCYFATSAFQCQRDSKGEYASRRFSRGRGSPEVSSTLVCILPSNLFGARRPINHKRTRLSHIPPIHRTTG